MSVQRSASPEMERLVSVRVRTRFSPAPAIRHTLQLQFLRNAATRRRTESDGGQAHRIGNLSGIRIRAVDSR